MIKKRQLYVLTCDVCESNHDIADESKEHLLDNAEIVGEWVFINNKHYCPKCYNFDENDNLIIKSKINE